MSRPKNQMNNERKIVANHKRTNRPMSWVSNAVKKSRIGLIPKPIVYVAVFGVIGLGLLQLIHAATGNVIEPETGTIAGNAKVVTNASASNGQYVQFNAATSSLSGVDIIAMPHPDDEMEAWSLIQGTSTRYKVFVYFTLGEETSYCNPTTFNVSFRPDLGETPPPYTPTGTLSSSCGESRITATLNFLNRMSGTDSSIPGGFSDSSYTTISLPDINNANPGHVDNGTFIADKKMRVYNSVTGNGSKGNVLFFNLGNQDLTKAEVVWALQSIINNRTAVGLPDIPLHAMIGPFAHTISSSYANCQTYDHPDHYAVHDALYNTDFGMPSPSLQVAATCATDPDYTANPLTGLVSTTAFNNAFAVNPTTLQREGFFQRDYGWMDGSDLGWYANDSSTSQISSRSQVTNSPFMKYQTFWQKYRR